MWNKITENSPPKNTVVWTKIEDSLGERNVQKLIFYKNLWWHTDKSMYVYYTPTHWKY